MAHEFVGPMPVEDFFKAFMRLGRPHTEPNLPKQWRGKFRAKLIKKGGFENSFINAVNRAEICPDLVLVNTTTERDDQFWRKPDITIYKCPYNGPPTTDFERMELHIERKTASEDPFSDPKSRQSLQKHNFEHNSKAAMKNRGQIISYTACQFASQHRSFTFSILFLDDYVRFIRWDRAGSIVTKRFNWRDDPKPLARFLWLFNHLSDADRGYDTSISKPTPQEIKLTKKKLDERKKTLAKAKGDNPRLAETRYSTDDSFRKFCVVDDDPDLKKGEARERFFVASVPQWQSGSPVGRGTRGYEALDLETGELVYLKDTWRYEADRMEKEGDTYRKIAANGVSHIPRLACAGDVEGQRTRTHDYTDEDWCCGEPAVRQHRHYRLVLKDLGRPLSKFNSTRELCQVLLEAIMAHMEAFKADVLHQDISGGNILITDDGHALLIDWELAKRVSEEKSPRQDWRTGTWQFISTAILENPRKVHELRDDLESFLHVLLYHSVRYQQNNIGDLPELVADFFDKSYHKVNGETVGGKTKRKWFSHHSYPDDFSKADLRKFLSKPHADLIERLRVLFFPLYAREETLQEMNPQPDPFAAAQILGSSQRFIEIFREQLNEDGWKIGDRSFDGLASLIPTKTEARGLAPVSTTQMAMKRTSEKAGLTESATGKRRKTILPPRSKVERVME